MGSKPKKHGTDWTEEMNQYILKNYFAKGIRAVAKDLGRTQEAIKTHISKLRCEGYFDNMFDHVSKEELTKYVMDIQDIHYELLNNLNDREDQTRAMINENLELHHVLYKEMLHKLKDTSND